MLTTYHCKRHGDFEAEAEYDGPTTEPCPICQRLCRPVEFCTQADYYED